MKKGLRSGRNPQNDSPRKEPGGSITPGPAGPLGGELHRGWLYLIIPAVGILLLLALLASSRLRRSRELPVVEESQDITLSLVCSHGDSSWSRFITDAARQFEQRTPGVRIQMTEGENEDIYDEYLLKLIATDSLGDIVEIRRRDFVEEGRLAPLPAKLVERTSDIYEMDGQIYAVGMSALSTGIIYNRQIFRQLGLSEPKTYGEFLELCQSLKAGGYTPLSVGDGTKWHMGFLLNHFFLTDVIMERPGWPVELKYGDASWTDQQPRQMFTDLYELFHSGYVGEDWLTAGDGMMPGKLAEGRTAMVYSGHWVIREACDQNPDLELGWFYLPNREGKVIVRDIKESYWGITAECAEDPKKYEIASEFLNFFYSEGIYGQFCRTMGSVSTVPDIQVTYDLPGQQEISEKFQRERYHTSQFMNDGSYPLDFLNKLLDIEYALLQDQIGTDEALKLCEQAYRGSGEGG